MTNIKFRTHSSSFLSASSHLSHGYETVFLFFFEVGGGGGEMEGGDGGGRGGTQFRILPLRVIRKSIPDEDKN